MAQETFTFSRALHCMRNSNTKARYKHWPENTWMSIDPYAKKAVLRDANGVTYEVTSVDMEAILGEWELSK